MTDKEVMQMALDVMLAAIKAGDWKVDGACDPDYVLEALRARLSQCDRCGEVNSAEIHTCTPQFNPDWDAMAVMVEEQQRMAKRIDELENQLAQPEQEPVAWRKQTIERCCISGARGVRRQSRANRSAQESYRHCSSYPRKGAAMTDKEVMQIALNALELLNGAQTTDGIFIYTDQETKALRTALAQPKREWVGLTNEEIREGNSESWVTTQAWQSACWWAEAKLKEKNT